MKSLFLLFDSDYTAEMIKGNVKEGKVILKDGEHIVDKTPPLQLKTSFGPRPLYLVKWDSLYPLTFKLEEKTKIYKSEDGKEVKVGTRELTPVKAEFFEKTKGESGLGYSPQMLKTTHDFRFLKNMQKYSGSGGGIDKKTVMTIITLGIMAVGASVLIYYLMGGGTAGGFKLF